MLSILVLSSRNTFIKFVSQEVPLFAGEPELVQQWGGPHCKVDTLMVILHKITALFFLIHIPT